MSVRGCCPLDCQDTCSWIAHVEDGRVVRMEGNRDHPFTRGALCAKVNDYQARAYAPDRLLHPLRRTGAKGAGEFERIAWADALDVIADRFRDIIDTYGGEALLPHNYLGSMGVVQRRALMRLFHVLGSSRFHGSICGAASNVVAAEGHARGFDPEDIVHSELVLLWGINILTTCHHHWHFIQQAKQQNGARIIAIDPRRTRTAAQCDEHIAIRPGTDRFLAAGMMRVLFEEGLADLEFARSVASDVDALRDEVAPWTPERVADVCGIDGEVVERLSREFARAKPATIRGGVAPMQNVRGEEFVRAISSLAILGGHWRHRGGGLFLEASPVLHEAKAERRDLGRPDRRSLDLARLGETLNDATLSPPVKALFVFGTNPAVVQPDAGNVRRGLAREDLFTVVVEHFLTDTARYADIVLPSTTQLEHFDIVGAWGHHYISVNKPAIAPVGEAKSHGEIMRLLAARMRLDEPALAESDERIARSALPDDIEAEALLDRGWEKRSSDAPRFRRTDLHLGGFTQTDAAPPRNGALQLLTPKSHYFMNSSFVNLERHRRAMGRPTLYMHPSDAAARSLEDGGRVRVANERDEVTVWLGVTDEVREGVVSLPGKWWSTPADTAAVTNLLSPPLYAPGGQPAYNDTWVEVAPAPEASLSPAPAIGVEG